MECYTHTVFNDAFLKNMALLNVVNADFPNGSEEEEGPRTRLRRSPPLRQLTASASFDAHCCLLLLEKERNRESRCEWLIFGEKVDSEKEEEDR